jgi:hypothetical protein
MVAFASASLNTVWQPGLRRALSRFRQATMRSTLGIAELQSRQTSPAQAVRCARVPCARLAPEGSARVITINTACRTVHGASPAQRFMSILPIRTLVKTKPNLLPPAFGIRILYNVYCN